MKEPDSSPDREIDYLRRRELEELARAKEASCSEDRIGHLALARAYARQIDRQNTQALTAAKSPGPAADHPRDGD